METITPETPAEAGISNYTANYYLGLGQVKELKVKNEYPEISRLEYSWKADGGNILSNKGEAILFQAPDYAGKINVSCEIKSKGKIIATHTFLVTAYKQVVVLKADDLVYVSGTVFPANWNKYFDLLDSMGIKGTAGIIGNSLENAPKEYYEKIKAYHKKGLVEFWNHGYTHQLGGRNSSGEVYHEFFNRDFKDQEKNLQKSQELGQQKLGITFRAFGAPGNGIDGNTTVLINKNNDIRIWFYGDDNSNKSILKRSGCEIEFPVHYPNYHKFLENYELDQQILTLQFHPTKWSPKEFDEFRRIVKHLQGQHVAFMNPTEVAAMYFPELVQDIEEINKVL